MVDTNILNLIMVSAMAYRLRVAGHNIFEPFPTDTTLAFGAERRVDVPNSVSASFEDSIGRAG